MTEMHPKAMLEPQMADNIPSLHQLHCQTRDDKDETRTSPVLRLSLDLLQTESVIFDYWDLKNGCLYFPPQTKNIDKDWKEE